MLQFFFFPLSRPYFLFSESRLLFLSKNFSVTSVFGFQLLFRLVIPIESWKNNAPRYCYANISLNMNNCLNRSRDSKLLKCIVRRETRDSCKWHWDNESVRARPPTRFENLNCSTFEPRDLCTNVHVIEVGNYDMTQANRLNLMTSTKNTASNLEKH